MNAEERQKNHKALKHLLSWVEEDFGEGFEVDVMLNIAEIIYEQPQMPFDEVLQHVALEWSK